MTHNARAFSLVRRFLADEVTLKYEGGPAAEGELDVFAVGGSILAFGAFANVATKALYHEPADVRTNIRGIRGGSFDIDFAIYISGVTAQMFAGQPLSFSDFIQHCLKLFKHLKGSPAKHVQEVHDSPGTVAVENNDGAIIQVNIDTLTVVRSEEAGKAVDEFIRKPLSRGVEQVRIERTEDHSELVSVNRGEADAFKMLPAPDDARKPIENIRDVWVTVERVVFVEGKRSWTFNDGESKFRARIADEAFLSRFNAGLESFAMGDQLRVRLRTTQTPKGRDLRVEHVIEEIYEHIHALEQESMF